MPAAPKYSLPLIERGSSFERWLQERQLPALQRDEVTTLQINVGKVCNQACHHCHVEAGPKRTEVMSRAVAERVLQVLAENPELTTLDITGGAPELNPNFRYLVQGARALNRTVIDRCNLTVLFEPGQADLGRFLAEHAVRVVASLPCYGPSNVDAQRGRGVFEKSVAALRSLNEQGYGRPGSSLRLDLVYNPLGASLPPAQAALETKYKQELAAQFGINFDSLLTITNMPIKRFSQALLKAGQHDEYMSLLVNHFNPGTLPGLMCRSLLSVGYDGQLYDCDFNQMLDMPLVSGPASIWDLGSVRGLASGRIATGEHCFGCTAGAGSSCGGALQ